MLPVFLKCVLNVLFSPFPGPAVFRYTVHPFQQDGAVFPHRSVNGAALAQRYIRPVHVNVHLRVADVPEFHQRVFLDRLDWADNNSNLKASQNQMILGGFAVIDYLI